MKGILLFAVLGLPAAASAQSVIVKCVDAKGVVIYQTQPCLSTDGQRYVSHKQYDAVYDDPGAARRVRAAELEVSARRADYGGSAQGAVIPASNSASACQSAKAHRESVLKSVGMRRTYDLLQQLDESVRRACK